MKQLVVVSGKGGTGKTSIAASIVVLAQEAGRGVVAADCDVDAANLGLLLSGEEGEEEPFFSGRRAWIDPDLCNGCASCVEFCPEGAIHLAEGLAILDPELCEGCGICAHICPTGAIFMETVRVGVLLRRKTAWGPMVHARLEPGEDNSGKLVTAVRQEALVRAQAIEADLVVVDGPPGIGCPVHAAMTGCDQVLAVTEPTVAGLQDLLRVLELAKLFRLPVAVLLNKTGLGGADGADLVAQAEQAGALVVGRLPFDIEVSRALVRGELPLAVPAVAGPLREAWANLAELLDGPSQLVQMPSRLG